MSNYIHKYPIMAIYTRGFAVPLLSEAGVMAHRIFLNFFKLTGRWGGGTSSRRR
jgi:hypothetical protein